MTEQLKDKKKNNPCKADPCLKSRKNDCENFPVCFFKPVKTEVGLDGCKEIERVRAFQKSGACRFRRRGARLERFVRGLRRQGYIRVLFRRVQRQVKQRR